MRAMVFAAGLGTRLAPLTDTRPKALIEVGGMTMLERTIENVRNAGADSVIVNIHHHADMMRDFISSHDFGLPVMISDESDSLLDTGGGVVKASPLLLERNDDSVLLVNADIYTNVDLVEMIKRHKESAADATLLVSERPTSRYLLFDDEMRMRGWENTATGEIRSPYPPDISGNCRRLAFGGIHVVSTRLVQDMAARHSIVEKFSITPYYIEACDRMDIRGFMPSQPYSWIDIGRPETLAKARAQAEILHSGLSTQS